MTTEFDYERECNEIDETMNKPNIKNKIVLNKNNTLEKDKIKEQLRKAIINSYPDLLDFDNSLAEYEQFIIQSQNQKIIEDINNLPNPYPLDLFPKLDLREYQTKRLNNFLISSFDFTFDRLSAELMRRARENCKLDILKSLGEKEQ